MCTAVEGGEEGVCNAEEEPEERDPEMEEEVRLAEAGILDDVSPGLHPLRNRRYTVGLWGPPSLIPQFRAAISYTRHCHGWHHDEGACIHQMLVDFAHTHVTPETEAMLRAYPIAERDRWVCAVPHCRSYGPFHRHHKQLRSLGGSDDPSNLFLMCDRCHEMLHAGKVIVRGLAPDGLHFFVGVRPDGSAREVWHRDMRVPRLEVPEGAEPGETRP